jgi:hypothetical protein
MDDLTPNTPVTPQNLLELHATLYREAARRQREQALGALSSEPAAPDYSYAATACHRAHQLTLQAETLETVLRELAAMRLTGEL